MRPHPLHPSTLCFTTRALDTPPKLYLKHLVENDPLVVEMRSRDTELHNERVFKKNMYKIPGLTQICYTLQSRYTFGIHKT